LKLVKSQALALSDDHHDIQNNKIEDGQIFSTKTENLEENDDWNLSDETSCS
jgi:hypothetical protein